MANIIKRGSLFVICLLFVFPSVAFAEPVTMTIAEAVGATFLKAQDPVERSILEKRDTQGDAALYYEGHSISSVTELRGDVAGDLLAYVFALEPKGFVVVSPDTNITPIIAYSFEGNFNWEDSEDNALLNILKYDMQHRVEALAGISEDLKDRNYDLWVKYFFEDADFVSDMTESTTYGPLVSTTWDQDSPYNAYCPMDPVTGSRSIVGCVATAMAQIVNYHACTTSVTFSSADNYTTSTRGISITASTANVSGISYPASDTTAARLSYACGVSVEMDYTSDESGAMTSAVADALKNKFGFTSATAYAPQSGYGPPVLATFYDKLQDNIMHGKPAQLAIAKSSGGGHSIVCDGYNSTTGQYHLNYGWGSSSPTPPWWYTLPSGMPSGYTIVKYGVLDITSSCKPSCPELYAWDGSGYRFVGSIFTRMHCPEAERYQPQPVTFPPVPQDDGTLTFLIKEVDREQSYINSTEMYYRYQWDTAGKWVPLPILSAMHNRTGDVIPVLGAKDDLRASMESGDEITLQYPVPPYGLEGIDFTLVSSGYYIWTDEMWGKVLAKGPDVVVEPGATVNLGALINNMGGEPLPDDAVVWFTLEDGSGTKVGPVSAAGLASGSSQLYLFDWTVPGHIAVGTYAYQVSIFAGGSDITWDDEYYGKPHPTDESGEAVSTICH